MSTTSQVLLFRFYTLLLHKLNNSSTDKSIKFIFSCSNILHTLQMSTAGISRVYNKQKNDKCCIGTNIIHYHHIYLKSKCYKYSPPSVRVIQYGK